MIHPPLDIASSASAPSPSPAAAASPPQTSHPGALEDALAALHARLEERAQPAGLPAFAGGVSDGFSLLVGLDPSLMISVIQAELRDTSSQLGEAGVADAAHHAEIAHAQEREALERSEKAGRRARRLMKRAPKWVKKLVSAIISAVGVLASAYTGGASLGLAIAGATLLLMADTLVPVLERAGVINAEQAGWIKLGLQVAGTVLTCCSGAGAANAVPRAVDAAAKASRVVEGTLEAVDGGLDIGLAVLSGEHDDALVDAGDAALDLEQANAALAEEIDGLGDSMEFFRRVAERMGALAEAEGKARLSSVRQLA